MDEKLTAIKVAIAAFFTALGSFLGWQGIMVVLWLIAMAIDYISGSLAAWLAGEWSSAVAREGIKHKAGMILVVVVAVLADITLVNICGHLPVEMTWPVLVLPLVLAWYILTELGSILENAVKMGAPMPQWLMKVLTMGLKAIDSKGEDILDLDNNFAEGVLELGEAVLMVGERDANDMDREELLAAALQMGLKPKDGATREQILVMLMEAAASESPC